jgi:hypothetical protein
MVFWLVQTGPLGGQKKTCDWPRQPASTQTNNMLPNNSKPLQEIIADISAHFYTKGRQDFVAETIKALSEPAFKDVPMTPAQVADMLKQASDKCDAVAAGKSLTN